MYIAYIASFCYDKIAYNGSMWMFKGIIIQAYALRLYASCSTETHLIYFERPHLFSSAAGVQEMTSTRHDTTVAVLDGKEALTCLRCSPDAQQDDVIRGRQQF